MKVLLSGNEAVARGAYEANCKVATAYPGTPSTEILENIADNYTDSIYCYWGSNEKTSLEEALGASFAGARSIVTMKHVGLNVAADPLFTAAYTGVGKGMIVVSADDPSNHSSQNEQDNRLYAMHAKLPCIEPSDSQETVDYVKYGFELSEKFDVPVLFRLTTRISHSKTVVEFKEPDTSKANYTYKKDVRKNIMVPSHSKEQHRILEGKLKKIADWASDSEFTKTEYNDKKIGIVTSGLTYQFVKEAFPNASILKIGMPYPLPMKAIKEFRSNVDQMWVVEELEPVIEMQIRMANIEINKGKNEVPNYWEMTSERVKSLLEDNKDFDDLPKKYNYDLPPRPPVLCAGCPHRAAFYQLGKKGVTVHGDIGCYTLGFLAPLSGMDTTICMGASITMGNGFQTVKKITGENAKVMSIIGDSTYMHSGLTGTVDSTYNKLDNKIIVLDNSITAMTGHQENPLTGVTLMGQETQKFDIEKFAEAAHVSKYDVVDGYNVNKIGEKIDEHLESDGTTMLVVKKPCVLKKGVKTRKPLMIDQDKCKGCKTCLDIGCPAIMVDNNDQIYIDDTLCVGCTVCLQVCPLNAIKVNKE